MSLLRKLCLGLVVLFTVCCQSNAQVSWSDLTAIPLPVSDATLQYGPDSLHIADIFKPDSDALNPAILIIHGGCWLNQYDRYYMSHLASTLSDSGLVAVNIEYRRVGDTGGGWPGTFDDIRLAYSYLKVNSETLRIDTTQIYVTGHSAGGHLALWLAANDESVAGVIGLAAITNLSEYATGSGSCQRATPQLMNGLPDADSTNYAQADPMILQNPQSPLVLISAELDVIVPPSENTPYVTKTRAQHHILDDVGHFDLVAPISPAWPDIIDIILKMTAAYL